MSAGWYCLDNDIILKLATCNIFDETLTTLAINYSQVNILETAKHKFRSLKKRQRGKESGDYNIESALAITALCSEISNSKISQDIFTQLQAIDGIDAGESVLISHVVYLNQQGNLSYLLTGDKRCLQALAKANEIAEIKQYLDRKVWCLEQLILKNIEEHGFDIVKQKMVLGRDCDQVIKAAFGSKEQSTVAGTKEVLTSYIQNLRQETGSLLNSYPE
jgi:glutaredoxin-related protein